MVNGGTTVEVQVTGSPDQSVEVVVSNNDPNNPQEQDRYHITLNDKGQANLQVDVPPDWKTMRVKCEQSAVTSIVLPAAAPAAPLVAFDNPPKKNVSNRVDVVNRSGRILFDEFQAAEVRSKNSSQDPLAVLAKF